MKESEEQESETKEHTEPKHELFSTRRIENLTDGVFAIAMTLLVLDLAVPVLSGTVTNESLWQALMAIRPNFWSFALSFAILSVMWSIHTRQFEYIDKVDRRVIFFNNLRLFVVVLIPFTTSLNGHYPNLLIGQIFYPINLFLLALVTYLQGVYVSSRHDFYKHYNKLLIDAGQARGLAFVIITAIVCVATVFIGSYAFFGFLLLPVLNIVLNKHYRKT